MNALLNVSENLVLKNNAALEKIEDYLVPHNCSLHRGDVPSQSQAHQEEEEVSFLILHFTDNFCCLRYCVNFSISLIRHE
jgi:hypothetical protein